ncbi:MAG: MFS transporter [Chloroflexota bacterium]
MTNPKSTHSAGTSNGRLWLVIFLISIAAFMGALDGTIVNISLPTLSEYFKADLATVSWVAMAYLLVLSSLLVTFGRIGDLRGFRKTYLIGFAVFSAGSMLCGLSPHIYILIVCRALQALGAAILQAIGGAMIIRYVPEENRGTALGVWITFSAIGLAAGTPLGGFICQHWGWHWIFFVNVPIGIIAIILGLIVLPKDIPAISGKFDLAGSGLIFAALGTLLFILNMGNNIGWISPMVIVLVIVSTAAWTGFIIQEKRAAIPLIRLDLFRSRDFTIGIAITLLVMLVAQGSWYMLPFYLEVERGLATDVAGLVLLIPALGMMLAGPAAGYLSDRIGSKPICILGSITMTCGLFILAAMKTTTSIHYISLALLLEGIGIGFTIPTSFNLILSASPAHGDEGMLNSLVATMRNMGAVMGIAVFGLIFMSLLTVAGLSSSTTLPHTTPVSAYVPAFRATFILGAVLCAVILALSIVVREKRRHSKRLGLLGSV